jgi:hypothetical protein
MKETRVGKNTKKIPKKMKEKTHIVKIYVMTERKKSEHIGITPLSLSLMA